MMRDPNRNQQKLRLHRETLRQPEERELKLGSGAATTISCELGSCFVTGNTRNTRTSLYS